MSRTLLLLSLLLAAGVVLADNVPEAEPVAPANEAQAQPEKTSESAPGATETQAQPDQDAASAPDAAETQAKSDQDAEPKAESEDGPKEISGMSVLGNREAPKSLVIVPWKSSVIGDSLGISTLLDDSRQPVDKEEFMRELRYYEIRSEMTP
jgi:hypothetical protein